LYFSGAAYSSVYVGEVADGACASFDVAEELLITRRPLVDFTGALLWELSRDRAPLQDVLFARVMSGYGVRKQDPLGPGYLFGPNELAESAALFGLFLSFSRGFYYVPADGRYLVRGDRDRFVDVVIADAAQDAGLKPVMEAWEWDTNHNLRSSLLRHFFR
jgi:hypothetical protein